MGVAARLAGQVVAGQARAALLEPPCPVPRARAAVMGLRGRAAPAAVLARRRARPVVRGRLAAASPVRLQPVLRCPEGEARLTETPRAGAAGRRCPRAPRTPERHPAAALSRGRVSISGCRAKGPRAPAVRPVTRRAHPFARRTRAAERTGLGPTSHGQATERRRCEGTTSCTGRGGGDGVCSLWHCL